MTDAIERKAIELWDEARAKYPGMVEWPHLVSFMQDEYRDVARASLDLEAARAITDKTPGQIAYEEDVLRRPTYDSGVPRKPWDKLANWARANWEMIVLPVETGRE